MKRGKTTPADARLAKLLRAADPREATRDLDGHPDALWLVRYQEDDLDDAHRAEVDAHLTSCVRCAAEVEGLDRLDAKAPDAPVLRRRPADALADLLRRLGELVAFDMPPALAVTTRGGKSAASPALAKAMAAYAAGKHADAAKRLAALVAKGEATSDARLYLGVSLMRVDRAPDALPHLQALAAERPRSAEARFYLAHALLRAGDTSAALKELDRVTRLPGPRKATARALARKVREAVGKG